MSDKWSCQYPENRPRVRDIMTIVLLATTLFAASCCKPCPPSNAITGGNKGRNAVASVPKDVTVTFQGSICHAFTNTRNRSILVKARQDISPKDWPHLARLWVPISANKAELDAATGITSVKIPIGYYIVSPLNKLAIRIVDWDGSTATPLNKGKLDHSLADFDKMVPHLAAEGSDGTMTDLSTAALADIPDDVDIAAFFELEGGTFSEVDPYCKPTSFIVDYKKLFSHDFAETVVLTGNAQNAIALQVSTQPNVWKTVTFSSTTVPVVIGVENLPDPPEPNPMSHFRMFKRLAKTPPTKFDDVVVISCAQHGAIPGCSDTQFP
jgi:hypothetical protein